MWLLSLYFLLEYKPHKRGRYYTLSLIVISVSQCLALNRCLLHNSEQMNE